MVFFAATSHPYTEGLAFAFGFLALLILDVAVDRPAVKGSLITAIICGLAFLTRSQMVVLGVGIAGALLASAVSERRYRLPFLVFIVIYASFVLSWWYFFVHALPNERTPIPAFKMWVETATWLDYVRERLAGIAVSFSLRSRDSYVSLFGPVVYLVPAAALLALFRRTPRSDRQARDWSTLLVVSATALAGIASYVSLNLYHETFFSPWLFGWRHGLPYLFLLLVSIPFLLFRFSRLLRISVVTLLGLSIIGSAVRTAGVVQHDLAGPTDAERQLLEWIERAHSAPPVILTTNPQVLSIWTDEAYFHWTLCREQPETTRVMVERLKIDYVLVYQGELRCPFVERAALRDILEPVARFGAAGDDAIYVLRPRRSEQKLRGR